MVKAMFEKKRFWNVFCLFCGLFIIGLFVFLGFVDNESTVVSIVSGIIFGAIICVFNLIFLLFNFKAYLYVEDGRIKGRYHYFGKMARHQVRLKNTL